MFFHLRLVAENDLLNRHRVYEIDVATDLFGDVLVEIRHGRKGRRLASRTIRTTSLAEAQIAVRERLRKRATAPRRIACSYAITDVFVGDNIDPAPFFLSEKEIVAMSIETAGGADSADISDTTKT